MAAFTASQASINNGSKVVKINSGESIANVGDGDFLVIANFIVEINRAYVSATNEQLIELVENWPNSNQNNQKCIVIPTTSAFKKAVDALSNANLLVNNNFTAMQDWQTKTGTVTFSNQDGTTTTVKTLKQIENEAQAQLDEYHPYPWAMRKVEFEARRAANNEKFAASGFVHFGKRRDGYPSVNEGLYEQTTLTSINTLFGGRGLDGVGLSKTPHAVINIEGIISVLDYGYSAYDTLKIKFPPAEDGTRTYDSATGTSISHATAALAFASETVTNKVVTDRADMWAFEGFLRQITNDDPFIYDKGLIQSASTEINGITTASDTIRSIEYFAWYEGDTTSRGKGVNWKTASEAQRIKIASDPYNNIYFDDSTGEFYQWCIRGRSFAGMGNGHWKLIDTTSNENLTFSDSVYVAPIGFKDSDIAYYDSNTNSDAVFYPKGKFDITFDIGVGLYQAGRALEKTDSVAVNGECYLLVCGTLNRLNKGARHPLNLQGASRLNSTVSSAAGRYWYQSEAISPTTKADLFNPVNGVSDNSSVGYAVGSGSVNSGYSGREDGRYYDAVYANGQGGVCRDMRYPARGLTPEDFTAEDLKIKSAKYRGREALFFVKKVLKELSTSDKASATGTQVADPSIYNLGDLVTVYNEDGKLLIHNAKILSKTETGINWDIAKTFDRLNGETYLVVLGQYTDIHVSDTFTHFEVMGDPDEIFSCDALKDGWLGSWNPTIPNGTSQTYRLTRPSINPTALQTQIVSEDQGATWTTSSAVYDSTTSLITGTYSASKVAIWQYETKAVVTKDALNNEVYLGEKGLGYVYASSDGYDHTGGRGRLLKHSLVRAVAGTKTYTSGGVQNLTLNSFGFVDGNVLNATDRLGYRNSHPAIVIDGGAGIDAFKALNYNVVKNQQAFINYAYAQLTYDTVSGDWGDDGRVPIVNNQSSMLDENGHRNLVGTAQCVESFGWIKNDK